MDIQDNEDKSTGMAQGQRAGLITLRSQDRNLLPVLVLIEFITLYGQLQDIEDKSTGMAQRKRAGLITPRT